MRALITFSSFFYFLFFLGESPRKFWEWSALHVKLQLPLQVVTLVTQARRQPLLFYITRKIRLKKNALIDQNQGTSQISSVSQYISQVFLKVLVTNNFLKKR